MYPSFDQPTYEAYTETTARNLLMLFDDHLQTDIDPHTSTPLHVDSAWLSAQEFSTNKDHGMEHAYNVFKESLRIAHIIEAETWASVDYQLLYIMSLAHDAARSIVYPEDVETSTPNKSRREKRNDKKHEYFWWIIVRNRIARLRKHNVFVSPDDDAKLKDYLINHDFFSQQLNGKRFQEPYSLEGQIVRLADRISVPLTEEIDRYRETWKRLKTPFFFPETDINIRMNFSFDDFWAYNEAGIIDEVMFFTGMLMINGSDFSHPILSRLYDEWATQKNTAAAHILDIARTEGTSDEDINKLTELLDALGKRYNFTL